MDTIEQTVIDIIAKEASIPRERIVPEATLQALDVHSLDGLQIIFEIEDAFDINVPEDQARHDVSTVGDLIAGVRQLVAAKTAASG